MELIESLLARVPDYRLTVQSFAVLAVAAFAHYAGQRVFGAPKAAFESHPQSL